MIDVLVPVLGRPKNARAVYASFKAHSGHMDEMTFLCSPGDDQQIDACLQTKARVLIVDFDPGPGDYARKMNYGYANSERPWLFLGADDIEFTPGWDYVLGIEFSVMPNVIATNDMANAQVRRGKFGTHCFVNRRYVTERGGSADGPGVLCHEGYDHNYVDRELCHLAQSRRTYFFAKDAIVRHNHPLWKTARMDWIYRKGLARFREDRELFLRRADLWNHVGLTPSERAYASRLRRDIVRTR